MSFRDRLTSLGTASSRRARAVVCVRSTCFYQADEPVSGRLGRFRLSSTANGAAVDTGAQTFGPCF